MRQTFMILIMTLIFMLSGCEEARIIDITGNEELTVYIGSNEDMITENLSVSGIDSEDYEITVDLSKVRIYVPGSYDITYFVHQNNKVVYREQSTIIITDTPLTDYPEINYTQDLIYIIGQESPNYRAEITVTDRNFGNLTSSLFIDDSSVNYNQVGSYEVLYQVTNSDNLSSSKTINVHVVENTTFSPLPDDFFIVENNNLYGIKTTDNVTIIPIAFDQIVYLKNSIVKLYIDDTPYYYNFETSTYFTSKYDIYKYSNGLAKAKNIFDSYGFVDETGQMVIPFMYDQATSFQNGMSKVTINNLQGLIDQNNNTVLPIQYEHIETFEDKYYVQKNDKVLILSNTGDTVFTSDDFNRSSITVLGTKYYIYKEGSNYGLVDENLNVIITPKYKQIEVLGSNIIGLTHSQRYELFNLETNNTYQNLYDLSIIDTYIIYQTETGVGVLDIEYLDTLIQASYKSITLLDDNMFLVQTHERYLGILNENNQVILPITYSQIKTLNNGFYTVTNSEGTTLLNNQGTIISNTYDKIHPFSEGYAVVEKDGLFGLIVEDGTEVLRLTYHNILPVTNGYIRTYNANTPNQSAWGVLNLNMQVVIPNMYAYIGPLQDGLFSVTKDYSDETSSGYMDETGRIVLALNYKKTTDLIDGYGIVTHGDNTKQVIDESGQFIHDTNYHNIEELRDDYFIVQSSDSLNSHCLMNKNGEIVTPCIYQYITPFIDGVATITTNEGKNYLTTDGDLLLDDYVNFVSEFQNGFGLYINKNNKTSIINTNGLLIYSDLFSAKILNEKYIAIKDLDTLKYGIYNTTGTKVMDHKFFIIEPFIDGFGVACLQSHSSCGVIDDSLETRVPFMYDFIQNDDSSYTFRYKSVFYELVLEDGTLTKTSSRNPIQIVYGEETVLYINNNKVGTYPYLDFIEDGIYLEVYSEDFIGKASLDGDILIEPIYDGYLYEPDRPYQFIITNGLYGVINTDNEVIISELYHLIEPLSEEYLLVVQGDYHGVFDIFGQMVIPVNYQSIVYITK